MDVLNIDIETYADTNLKKHGVYRYTRCPSFEILIFGYSLNGAPVECVDLAKGEKIPKEILQRIYDPGTLKKAWNATFERLSLEVFMDMELDPDQWECTMIKAAMLGLPMNLEDAAIALGTDSQKAVIGKSLIRIFSIPCKATASNGMRTRNLPEHFPEKWEQYLDYNVQDVYTEMEIGQKIDWFTIPAKEKLLYNLDAEINDRGVLLDPILITNAIAHSKRFTAQLLEEAKQLTGLNNPKSVKQLKEWLELEIDEEISTLKKDAVHALLKNAPNEIVKRVLTIRQQISKTSIKKYDAMLKFLGSDNRGRGFLQFLGANRTWRWAGRGVQPQNLPQNHMPDLEFARELEYKGDFDTLDMCYDTPDMLSQLIRTAFIAPKGKTLIMSDFSAIEACVLAWMAGEQWKINVFKGHGKIYEATAVQMFKIPIEQVTKKSAWRQRAKICELLCGYQGGVKAILRDPKNRSMGSDDEIAEYIGIWRSANKKIVQFWYDVDDAAKEAIRTGQRVKLRNLTFYMDHGTLFIKLPSGRSLAYLKAAIETKIVKIEKPIKEYANGVLVKEWIKKEEFEKEVISYRGIDQKTKQWTKIYTYGGKLVENIVQAISRDLLAAKMLKLKYHGYLIVFHVHDEVVIEIDISNGSDLPEVIAENELRKIDAIMRSPLSWSEGLPLNAISYYSPFYKKD